MSENSSEKYEMSETAFAQEMLHTRIAPPSSGQSVKGRINAASRRLRWSFNRTRTIWYADERASLKPRELRTIEAISGVQYARQELRTNAELLARADALLMGNNADFYRAFVTALHEVLSPQNRPGTKDGD